MAKLVSVLGVVGTILGLGTAVQALTLGWDAPATLPAVPATEELRYLVQEQLPGSTAWVPRLPALPLTQRQLAVPVATGPAGSEHCFRVFTVRVTTATQVILATSPAGTLQADPLRTDLCVSALPLALPAPLNFRWAP